MNSEVLARGICTSILILMMLVLQTVSHAEEKTLEYSRRYNCQQGEPDHLLDAVAVSGNRVIVAGNKGLTLVDLDALTPGGTSEYLHRLTGLNARNLYVYDGDYIFVNLNRNGDGGNAGFAVVKLNFNTLQLIDTFDETGIISSTFYDQPRTGLPFGRGFIIDRQGKVASPYFGHNPPEVIQKIRELRNPGARVACSPVE